MFDIGDQEWPGISKLVEECGEVLQIVGKLIATRGQVRHWNVPDLKVALEDELGDALAAIEFVMRHCHLNVARIVERRIAKLARFEYWHHEQREPLRP